MTPERWQQVKEIFNSAIKYRPEERQSFLNEVCSGDHQLRSEVESLIASHEKPGTFIDAPAYEEAAGLVGDTTQLRPGQVLGSYEVISFISRGGMGEVYLAQDKRLSRRVALKLLPVTFTRDNDRLRRFEQEARAASALNHPNIITIYEIRELASSHVIATEFVEGETLRQRLGRSTLPLSTALNVGIQIADALSAAHKAGIIHRDIKPENVMLRPDGYVKVLDFGLAKLNEEASDAVAAEAPTIQVRTGSGIVIGTAGYMSPEQARGIAVDGRSDIFSLGAVLYEMVAHRKPFEGDTPSDILASILKTEPHPLAQFVPDAPAELVRIIMKALRKDREERYQVVKDLLLDLKALKQELEFQAKLQQSSTPTAERRSAPTNTNSVSGFQGTSSTHELRGAISTITQSLSGEIKRHRLGTAAVMLMVAAVLLAGAFAVYKLTHRPPKVTHFQNTTVTRLTNTGKVIDATITPDGRYIVYSLSDAGKQSIWLRQVSNANDTLIVPPAAIGLFGMTISRDGNEIYYAVKQNLDAGTLYRVPLLGGTPQKVLTGIDGPVSFSPDGKRLTLVRSNFPGEGQSALVVADTDGSHEVTLATRKRPESFAPIFFTGPSWSPDGKQIAAAVSKVGAPGRVLSFEVEGGKEHDLTPSPWPYVARVEWLPDMSGLLVIAGPGPALAQLWFLSYPDGEKRPITNDLNAHRAIGLTADGNKMVVVESSGLVNIWVAPEGDAKRVVQMPVGNLGFFGSSGNSLAWTPDGRIVFASNESLNIDLWTMDANGGNRKQLTSNAGRNTGPVVSPDGRYIVFSSTRSQARNIWRMNIDGSGSVRLTEGLDDFSPTISPDGKWVIYSSLGATRPTIWKISIDGGTPVQITQHVSNNPMVSPDGKFIAYLYPEAADPLAPNNRIAIIPFEGGEPIKTFGFQGATTVGTIAEWSKDGKSILYTSNNNNVTNIWAQPIDGGAPKQITDFKDSFMSGFAWSRDGKQLASSRGILLRDAVLITSVK